MMGYKETTQELYRRYLEAKRDGRKAVFCADLYPNEIMSAGARSVALLDRINWDDLLIPSDRKEVEDSLAPSTEK